jgi:hypothetical protein
VQCFSGLAQDAGWLAGNSFSLAAIFAAGEKTRMRVSAGASLIHPLAGWDKHLYYQPGFLPGWRLDPSPGLSPKSLRFWGEENQ